MSLFEEYNVFTDPIQEDKKMFEGSIKALY